MKTAIALLLTTAFLFSACRSRPKKEEAAVDSATAALDSAAAPVDSARLGSATRMPAIAPADSTKK